MVQYNGRHGFVVKLLQTLLKSHQETPGKLIDA
jgi:hypothetical protein